MDRLALLALSRGMHDSFDQESSSSLTLEEIVDQTRVNRQRSNLYNLLAPGMHAVWLDTPLGEIRCLVKVRLAIQPTAPLLLYHHGIAEIPFTSTWYRILPKSAPFPAHAVAVQAPYHNSIRESVTTGFASVNHVYQMFAGSLRVYELMQDQFENNGAAFTVASGFSWGGITSLLYEGLFGKARATVPLFASPNLAQVIFDSADVTRRPLPVSREVLDAYFDFTPLYRRSDVRRIFPVIGEDDLFFRYDRHAMIYSSDTLQVVKGAHVGAAYYLRRQLRGHLLEIIRWAEKQPR